MNIGKPLVGDVHPDNHGPSVPDLMRRSIDPLWREARETPKQYSARHLRRSIERAKVAVMQAQEELQDFRGSPATYKDLLDSAFSKLDCAWRLAAETESR